MTYKVVFGFTLLAAGAAFGAERGEEIKLWPTAVAKPDVTKPSVAAKYSAWPGDVSETHNPSIYVFLPPKEKATGVAMVVAPGGGQSHLVMEKEGWEIADWLNSQGIAAFVLKYRLAKAKDSKYALDKDVYEDAARSMRLVRSRAKEWGVNPAKLGFIGFSAGGEVAGMMETKFDAGDSKSSDPIERVSSRPDFNVLIYPYYRPLSISRGTEIIANPTFPATKDDPPVFMVCADDDRSHVEPTVKFYLELEQAHVPAEMHIYAYGGHGFGLNRPTARAGAPVETWPARLVDWMAERGITK